MDRRMLYSSWHRPDADWTATLSLCAFILAVACVIVPVATARPLISEPVRTTNSPRRDVQTAYPVYESRLHYANRVWVALTNWGVIGAETTNRVAEKDRQVLGIDYSPSFEFPGGTRNEFLYGGSLWVGGTIGTDTLVSSGMMGLSAPVDEWNAYDTVSESSSDPASPYYQPGAQADQEYFVRVYDTLVLDSHDDLDDRPHIPLNLEVSQTSYAWGDQALQDIILIQYWIRNIGTLPIGKLALGVFLDCDVFNVNSLPPSSTIDDVSGFVRTYNSPLAPSLDEYLNIAWTADNDGDPVSGSYQLFSPSGAIGLRMLQTPPIERISFNWWLIGGNAAQRWGPVRDGARTPAPGGGLGSPIGDRNDYYVMTNGEIDYDQYTANLDHTSDGWRPPLRYGGCDIADGLDTRFLLSAGPACDPLLPGDSVPFVIALIGGDGFHADPLASLDCRNPDPYMAGLDYSGLVQAARWAAWMYDAPGVDTDGDGYRGEFVLINGDTVFYTGDMGTSPNAGGNCGSWATGAPDFVRPEPPPCPEIQVETSGDDAGVFWNGQESETARDLYLQRPDFQGYRLYVSPTGAPGSYSLVDSWDIDEAASGASVGVIQRTGTDSVITGDGEVVRFGVYEAILSNLGLSNPVYLSVTAYDSGSDALRLNSLESVAGACFGVAGPVGPHVAESHIDLNPGQCPNWLAPAGPFPLRRGLPGIPGEPPLTELKVTILGRNGFDVHDLDLATVRLEGCPATGFEYTDGSSPFIRDGSCDCWAGSPDGLIDLNAVFDKTALFEALGPVAVGDQIEITLTATLRDGAPFTGHDCATIGSSALTPLAANSDDRGGNMLRCFPNPFNAAATISYTLADAGPVSVEVFDILGRRVMTLVDAVQSNGSHTIAWNGTDDHERPVASGTYLCRLHTSHGERTVKLLLLK